MNCLNGLGNLKELFLSWNKLKFIDPFSFKHTPALTSLHLENNKIDKIERIDLKNLQNLCLSGNEIVDLPDEDFNENFKKLEQLDLSNNFIVSLKEASFRFCLNLTLLDLNANRIESIDESTFDSLVHLKSLKMSSTLTSSPLNLSRLLKNKSLRTLDLSRNTLTLNDGE